MSVKSRRRGALSINGIQQAIKEHTKSVTDSDKYGKSVWCDLTEWEDGTFSISSYDGNTSIRLSGTFKFKDGEAPDDGLDF